MSGLFQRALELTNGTPEPSTGDELVFDEESGISTEDQKEILAEIDQVVRDNRISVTPETLKIQAQKRGTLFPLLVNVTSIVLLAAGALGFYLLFQRGESGLRQEVGALVSAEGKLIEELKKESEARLLEKNREIGQIQGRLEEIDRQRQDLQTNMDARISAREEQLRAALESELGAERERLRQEGISENVITVRVQELEVRKTEQYQQELTSFSRQADEERRQAEASLAALRQEYEGSLTKVSQDRARVLEEAQAREADLRRQLDARTQALEQETQAARQELISIAEQRKKEELAASQLVGLYNRVKASLDSGRFQQALSNLNAIKEYLNDPKVAGLPSMLERREIELFVVDSIASLVRSELGKEQVDTSSLIAAANLVTELKNRVVQADGLYRQGQVDQAEGLYREALAMIPEVGRAHEYFLTRLQGADTGRAAQLRDYLRRAGTAFAAGDHEATLANYTRALEYLPEERTTIERLIAQVRQSGFQLELLRLRRNQTAAAADALGRANRLLDEGQHSTAIAGYMDLIKRFPNSDQVAAAVEGINRAVEAKGVVGGGDLAALRRELSEKDAEIVALRQQLENRTGERGDLQKALEAKTAEAAALKAELDRWKGDAGALQKTLDQRLAELEKELDGKVAVIGTLQQEKGSLEEEIAALREEIRGLQVAASRQQDTVPPERLQELMGKVERLEALEARYNRLVGEYRSYVSKETALLSGRGSSGLVESKVHLNAFLASTEETFPGLWVRIKRYDEAFEKAGRAGATKEIGDILYELSYVGDPAERAQYLDRETRRYPDDPLMREFLGELKGLPAGGPAASLPSFNRYLDLLAQGGALDTSQMSLLDELALRTSRESRLDFLTTELLRARKREDTTLLRLIEDLLALVRSE